ANPLCARPAAAEVMPASARSPRNDTPRPAPPRAGGRVAAVTAKEKLRDLLAKGLDGIAFSSERAGACTRARHGVEDVERLAGPAPAIYSADASEYVLRAGAALLEAGLADFLYLTTTDYVQHTHAPGEPEALAFHAALDQEIGRLLARGAVVAITADHGMNAKCDADGRPSPVDAL